MPLNLKAEIPIIKDVDDLLVSMRSEITQTAEAITLKVSKNELISSINQTAETIKIHASKIDLEGYVTISSLSNVGTTTIDGSNITTGKIRSSNFSLTGTGYSTTGTEIRLTDGVIRTPTFLLASDGNAYFKGVLQAPSGNIGGWTIGEGYLDHAGSGRRLRFSNVDSYSIYAGDGTTWNFLLNKDGTVNARNANITGTITATGGSIGGCEMNTSGLFKNNGTIGFGLWSTTAHSNIAFHAGANSANIGTAPTRIYHNGAVSMEKLDIMGGTGSAVTCQIHDIYGQGWTDMFGSGIQIRATYDAYILSMNRTGVTAYHNDHSTYVAMTSTYVSVVRSDGYSATLAIGGVTTGSMSRFKDNIVLQDNLLKDILDTDVYQYNFKAELKEGIDHKKYGFVIGEDYNISNKVKSATGDGVDLYSSIAIAWGGIKELHKIITELTYQVNSMQLAMLAMKGR